MESIDYRIIAGRRDVDIKALAAISVLDNRNPEALAEGIDYFRDELARLDPASKVLIGAFAGCEVLGFTRFEVCPRLGLWWCRGLVVAVEWQRRGIGAALLKSAIRALADRGERDIRSDTWAGNTASQATHLRAGFVLVSMDGTSFEGQRLENHPFYQWRKPS